MVDQDGYPDEASLEAITKFDMIEQSAAGKLWKLIKENWHWPDWGWTEDSNLTHISTGGWSGNESVITAMEQNFLFWSLQFVSRRTGGHYTFQRKREDLTLDVCDACHGAGMVEARDG